MAQTGEIDIPVNDLTQGGILKIPLSVLGTQAEISAQPMALSFPLTVVGQTSNPQMVTVTNTGAAPLTGIDVVIAGTNASDFVPPPGSTLPMSVPTGGNFSFPVSFRPTTAKALTAIVVVKAAGLMAPLQIKADGQGKLLAITCSPDSRNFGNLPLGMTKADKVVCTNSDSDPIDFMVSLSDFPDDWSFDPTDGTIAGSSGGNDGVQTLMLNFHPTALGPRTTTISLKTKDGLLLGQVSLDGNGTTPAKDKTEMNVGCSYSGRQNAAQGLFLMLLALGGFVLIRRRRYA
jgi:MYXO-CTERM domain-containing protein